MSDRVETGVSEFNNRTIDLNLNRFKEYHEKMDDIHVTVNTSTSISPKPTI